MKKEDVLAIYEAELERCRGSSAQAADATRKLLAEIDWRIEQETSRGADAKRMEELRQVRAAAAMRDTGTKSVEFYAWQGTRTKVHEQLFADALSKMPHQTDDFRTLSSELDADLVHAEQKAHGKNLWAQTDKLIASAGVTESGRK